MPVVAKVKKAQRKRIGVDQLKFYDDIFMFPDGNAKPFGTSEEILAAGRKMYHELSPETAEFIDFMYENGLFDVLAKEGKAPGGYCTEFPDYDAPFIFSNFNGTSGDVDVLTHEAGHAFAFYRAARHVALSDFHSPTIEACECHSMSMEFLTAPYHALFFGDAVKKYELSHCEDSVIFIPYGCMVDEFQHKMYENPELSPEQRNEFWLSLEKSTGRISISTGCRSIPAVRAGSASCIFICIRFIISITAWHRPWHSSFGLPRWKTGQQHGKIISALSIRRVRKRSAIS